MFLQKVLAYERTNLTSSLFFSHRDATIDDKMSLDAVLRPNLVVLAGLCLLLCVADIRFLRCRKPSANPGLTRQHVLLGLLSLLCSLVCTFDIILFARKETCDQLASIFVGSLWVSCTRQMDLRP